jgi:hypothetical protein
MFGLQNVFPKYYARRIYLHKATLCTVSRAEIIT